MVYAEPAPYTLLSLNVTIPAAEGKPSAASFRDPLTGCTETRLTDRSGIER